MIFKIDSFSQIILPCKHGKKKQIFSFWEPKEKLPGYISLCIKTWKKYLPDYEIKILDYKYAKELIGDNLFHSIISESMPLSIQADAIRVALLNKYGGIWIDADTIITSGEFLKGLEKYELVMLGGKNIQHIGFIFASKTSNIIKKWLSEIINRVDIYNQIKLNSGRCLKIINWNFLGNGIVNKLLNHTTDKEFFRLNKYEINCFPEIKIYENTSLEQMKQYNLLYFQKREPNIILNNTKGIILLHNSWTPIKYKAMSEQEFLKEDILLSRLLAKILNISL